MSRFVKHYGVMWIVFVLLVFIGVIGLEIIEGEKIKTTEYYGLQNIRYMYFAVIFLTVVLPASMLYYITVLPLSVLLRNGTGMMYSIRTVVFIILGAAGGKWVFHKQYSDFVERYELNDLTASTPLSL